MATLAEIGFSIRNQIKGYYSSDDERIDIEFVYKKIRDVRSLLIKQQSKADKTLAQQYYTRICCLEVKCEEEMCNNIPSGVIKYFVDLPDTEGIPEAIAWLGTTDDKYQFTQRDTWTGFLYSKHNRYTGKQPYFVIIDNRAYLENLPTDGIKFVCGVVILEDPLNGKCYTQTENDEYPIPEHTIHELELIVIKQLMATLQIVPDAKNNASNNPVDDQKRVQ